MAGQFGSRSPSVVSQLSGIATSITPATSTTIVGNDNDYIQKAVEEGKRISGALADILRQSTRANNQDSNLQLVLTFAEELRDYQSPVESKIGLVGDSGVGKSSLINSLLNQNGLAKTACTGRACTSVVTEYRKKRGSDDAPYTVEIERMNDAEIEELLRQSIIDYRRYHLREPGTLEESEEAQLLAKAKTGWNTLEAAFSDREGFNERFFGNPDAIVDDIVRYVCTWSDAITTCLFSNRNIVVHRALDVTGCLNHIDPFIDDETHVWQFIKVIRIYLNAEVLQAGVVLVDLPGFRDVNSARVRITETRLYQCDEIFVVTDIARAATNVGVENIIVRQLGSNFDGLKRSQGVAIICTKSESLRDQEVLRDVPNTEEFNPRTVRLLDNEIREAEEEGLATHYLTARKNNLLIIARNEHVASHLRSHYVSQQQIRNIDVFCVSNVMYEKAYRRIASARLNQRRRSNLQAMEDTANLDFASSGINDLRSFCQRIPSKSQISEAKHFLNTRVVTLLEKTEMWLTAAKLAIDQRASPDLLNELQEGLKISFQELITNNHEELNHSKTELLHLPYRRGMDRWKQEALSAIKKLERWHVASLTAFWSHEGAHSTYTQGYTDWNANIIKAMVSDTQNSEDLFCVRSRDLFKDLEMSIRNALSELFAILEDALDEVEIFRRSFPRRRRQLDHDISDVKTKFFDMLQIIFHELFRTHGTSYAMHHMLPMYNVIESRHGVKNKIIERLNSQVTGDRNTPGLFELIRRSFISDVDSLISKTNERLQRATNKCCEDIKNDIALLRGENTSSTEQDNVLNRISAGLERSRASRDLAEQIFDASVVEH